MERRQLFLNHISSRLDKLESKTVSSIVERAGNIERVYIVFIDILRGFCEQGSLASDRVAKLITPVRELTDTFLKKGLPPQNLVFLNDAHPEDAVEFSAFPAHCMRGTVEAEVVDELKPLYEKEGIQIFDKNATNGMFGKRKDGLRFFEWLEQRLLEGPATFLIVGDCTDLCIYQNATGIKLFANELNIKTDVIVSQQHSETYDLSVSAAESAGILAHDADLLDDVFYYHMMLNDVEVVKTIELT